ncbi:MAG: RNA polymerase factor sigma-54 [Paraprevotella sp.]|nr:RNA polymerase factor sigma-54 [Paraprevotella sp.]
MAQKLVQSQSLQQIQTLSPQQVLQVRLLEMPVSELEQRVKNELIDNGALEERLGNDEEDHLQDSGDSYDEESRETDDASDSDGGLPPDEFRPAEVRQAMDDYRSVDDVPDYLLQDRGGKDRPESLEYGDTTSFYEQMTEQMNECDLTPRQKELMTYLIGSLESDGLLKKKLSTLADELEIYNGVQTSAEELQTVLAKLQTFDPPGIGARDLRECLLLQIRRDENFHTRLKKQEYEIIDKLFDEFTHKRWDRIRQKLHLSEAEAERLQKDLRRLNPRPGSAMGEVLGHNYQQIVPDLVVTTEDDGSVTLSLNKGDVPDLHISPSFMELMSQADSGRSKLSRSEREALQYTKQKIEKAKGFIEAVKQRRRTLTAVMQAIVDLQRPFFVEGDETLLRPMILKDVAGRTGLDISTVSRAANSKYVETNYGTYPLKWFFSDGYVTDDGQEIATRKIQAALKECIEAEDKKKPLSDEVLTAMLNEKGFPIARRTVAKYREQLGIPVARLRK